MHAVCKRCPGVNLKLTSIYVAIAAVMSSPAVANPLGGEVVSGSATIDQQGNTLTINAVNGTIVNWKGGFSIGPNETTIINLPSATSQILNRDIGGNPSQILGSLLSNGRVFIINPNGIIFGANARVDVAGLVASTLKLSDADFLAGKLNFTDGANAGKVINQGAISAAKAGSIIIVAADVENRGIITAPDGQIFLAAGESVYIADPKKPEILIKYSNTGGTAINLGTLAASSISIAASIINHAGLISANTATVGPGGKVMIKAGQAVTLQAGSHVNADGTTGGEVTVQAEAGTTLVQGDVSVTGSAGKGGSIKLLGEHVGVLDNASIDASGTHGGGEILVGGDYQGKNNAIQNASATYFASTAKLKADAIDQGDGGKVIVWADKTTRAYGDISAKGGAVSGNGGFIETSGKQTLDVAGIKINAAASAAGGKNGQWLLDPSDITVISGSAGALAGGLFDPASNSSIGDAQINAALNGGTDVTLQTSGGTGGSGNITVNSGVAILNSSGGTRSLALHADNSVIINSGASISGSAGNALNVDIVSPAGTNLAGTIANGTLTYSGGAFNTNNGILDGVTIGSSLTQSGNLTFKNATQLANGITINAGNGFWSFSPTTTSLTTSGTATINMADTVFGVSGTLNIGAGITMQGTASFSGAPGATLNNAGSIIANTSSGFLNIGIENFNNSGTLTAVDGILTLGNGAGLPFNFNNSGTMTMNSPGRFGGIRMFLPTGASITNTGTFNLTQGQFYIFGNYSTSQLGAFLGSGIYDRGTGQGQFILSGVLDNTATTLDIGSAGIFGLGGLDTLFGIGSTIIGGTIINTDSTPVFRTDQSTLDGVTIGSNMQIFTGDLVNPNLQIKNNLQLANGVTINLVDRSNFNQTSRLSFDPGTTLTTAGSATINMAGGSIIGASSGALDIASGITLQGYGTLTAGSGGTINNAGNIIADTSGMALNITSPTFHNTSIGTLSSTAGDIALTSADFNNDGTVNVGGGTVSIAPTNSFSNTGNVNVSGGALALGSQININALIGHFSRTGGTLSLPTVFDLGGSTIDIDDGGTFGIGGLGTLASTLTNGTITGTSLTSSTGTLDGITIGTSMTGSGLFNINNGLILANGVNFDIGASTLNFNTSSQSVTTAGSATLTMGGGALTDTTATSLTIGSGVALRGNGSLSSGSVIINGIVAPGFSPGTINVSGNLVLGPSSITTIELGGAGSGQYDVINVSGVASLNGTLNVVSFSGFTPASTDTFDFMTFSSSTGNFASTNIGFSNLFLASNPAFLQLNSTGTGGGTNTGSNTDITLPTDSTRIALDNLFNATNVNTIKNTEGIVVVDKSERPSQQCQ